ncbi:MAG: hypothetical protein INQ03_12435 [Candidatus Heimdallarchaeota archaeon]|nr:hypothetical protein [Candidatus Heimdallarchaeota archaeon]
MDESYLDAVYFYYGILESYEVVGQELIGESVLEDHVVPRMTYYVKNFLPKLYNKISENEIKTDVISFLTQLKDRIEVHDTNKIPKQDIWLLRAAIFGYESSFLEILGENVIKQYVLKRIPEILAVYLPEVFTGRDKSLEEKLQQFAEYIKIQNFAKITNFELNNGKIIFSVNKCAFADIHSSDAYLEKKTRFCPWGMMVLAIVNDHQEKEFPIQGTTFVTRGTITELEII